MNKIVVFMFAMMFTTSALAWSGEGDTGSGGSAYGQSDSKSTTAGGKEDKNNNTWVSRNPADWDQGSNSNGSSQVSGNGSKCSGCNEK